MSHYSNAIIRRLPLAFAQESIADPINPIAAPSMPMPPTLSPGQTPSAATASEQVDARIQEALGSVHSAGFPELLRRLDACLLVTTYQAGKLVVLRADGEVINTHFRSFNTPMGLAADANRLALGTRSEIIEFRNMPDAARRLHDPPRHDAVYLARHGHITGAIDIHEMAWDADGELWFVNTLFSALCTRDASHSFVPRWRPAFISGHAPEDRCHLNGLGMRDGQPRYLTALAQTNTAQGWREHKADGGVLMDCVADETIARGLAMPHSPRWHDGRLWLLESGRGALVVVDPQTGEKSDVVRLPGFVRGMDMFGKVAFVGLSQLRDNHPFGEIDGERQCGVWAVHIDSGQILGLLKFTGGVQEIFAVSAIAGVRFPEIIHDGALLDTCYALPDSALASVERTRQGESNC